MPAQNDQIELKDSIYIHTSREVKQEIIFSDNQDYQTFIKFLKDYFYDTNKNVNSKKIFTIRGKTYKGFPYQIQNYFNQIVLLAYKLEPNRFDLVIKENVPGTTEKFIRAISTRYVLYFNKKHNRSGSLFRDPYNLKQITNIQELSQLIQYLHSNFSSKEGVPNHYFSSYPEYLGQRITEWINSREIQSDDNLNIIKSSTKANDINIENETNPTVNEDNPRIPEIISAVLILFIFSTYSFYNIQYSKINSNGLISPLASPPKSQVSGIQDVNPDPSPTPVNPLKKDVSVTDNNNQRVINTVMIKITDRSESVELRLLPTYESEVISIAKDGEEFELVFIHPQWYEIKLNENQNAFVPESYSEIKITEVENHI